MAWISRRKSNPCRFGSRLLKISLDRQYLTFIVKRSERRAALAGHDRASEGIKGYKTPQSLLLGWDRGLPRGQYPYSYPNAHDLAACPFSLLAAIPGARYMP